MLSPPWVGEGRSDGFRPGGKDAPRIARRARSRAGVLTLLARPKDGPTPLGNAQSPDRLARRNSPAGSPKALMLPPPPFFCQNTFLPKIVASTLESWRLPRETALL